MRIENTLRVLALIGCLLLAGTAAWWSKSASADEPFLGQIDYYAFSFPPSGWTLCDGALLSISLNQSLFSLLGNTFGGDGRTNFALPDMRGRIPVHDGGSAGTNLTRRVLGEQGGEETHVLSANELPAHSHTLRATTTVANQVLPESNTLANDSPNETYSDEAPDTDMHPSAIAATSAGAHPNMPPFLVVSCAIALQGIFPPRN